MAVKFLAWEKTINIRLHWSQQYHIFLCLNKRVAPSCVHERECAIDKDETNIIFCLTCRLWLVDRYSNSLVLWCRHCKTCQCTMGNRRYTHKNVTFDIMLLPLPDKVVLYSQLKWNVEDNFSERTLWMATRFTDLHGIYECMFLKLATVEWKMSGFIWTDELSSWRIVVSEKLCNCWELIKIICKHLSSK